MSPLFKVVASVLLTAAIAFGNCSMCITYSLSTRSGQHACCKPKKAQPPCHKNTTPEPVQHQDGCSSQFASLQTAQATERVSVVPVLVATADVDLLATAGQSEVSQHLASEVQASGVRAFRSFITPLRI